MWKSHRNVSGAIKSAHRLAKLGHHDWPHDQRVSNAAYQFALSEWNDESIATFAGLAGLLHSADRIFPMPKNELQQRQKIERLIMPWLHEDGIATLDAVVIRDAVLEHSGRDKNDDSPVLIALRDADRFVNLSLDLIMRAGQMRPRSPSVDYKHYASNPDATYKDPRSVLRDILYALDWVTPGSGVCVRTKLATTLCKPRAERLSAYAVDLKVQLVQEGMLAM